MSESSEAAPNSQSGNPYYAYKPSLMGAPCEFELRPDALHWRIGRRAGRIRYVAVRRLQMSYRPRTLQSQRFVTEIRSDGTPKIQIISTSWRSVVEHEQLGQSYGAFVTELHRRLATPGAVAQFSAGMPVVTYAIGVALFGAVVLACAVLGLRALELGQYGGAAFIGLFIAVFAVQLGGFFRRNRPRSYLPDALPAAVMPRPKP